MLGGKRFANTHKEETESAVDGYFKELEDFYYKQGIEANDHGWEKCIELKADYQRNKEKKSQIVCVFCVRPDTFEIRPLVLGHILITVYFILIKKMCEFKF